MFFFLVVPLPLFALLLIGSPKLCDHRYYELLVPLMYVGQPVAELWAQLLRQEGFTVTYFSVPGIYRSSRLATFFSLFFVLSHVLSISLVDCCLSFLFSAFCTIMLVHKFSRHCSYIFNFFFQSSGSSLTYKHHWQKRSVGDCHVLVALRLCQCCKTPSLLSPIPATTTANLTIKDNLCLLLLLLL